MSPAVVLYTIAIGALVLGVATASAAALGYLKRPTRWVWMIALTGTAALPFLPRPSAPAAERVAVPASDQAQVVSDAALARLLASASETLPAQTRDPLPWIPIVWILGSATTLGLLMIGVRRIRGQVRDWRTRRVDGDRVWVSRAFGPAVIGFLRPEVVLPTWTLELEPRERRMILLHENEHRRARDPLLLFVGAICLVVTPWNPFLWLQFRGLRRAIEFDCDRRVLARGAAPRAYGRLLLSLQLRDGRGALFAPALREPASFLERRLKMMTLRDRPVPRGRVAVLTGLAVILGVVACEAPQPVGPDEAPNQTVTAPSTTPAQGTATLRRTIEDLPKLAEEMGLELALRLDGEEVERLPADFDYSTVTRYLWSTTKATDDGGDGGLLAHIWTDGGERMQTIEIPPSPEFLELRARAGLGPCPEGRKAQARQVDGVVVTGCEVENADGPVPGLREDLPDVEIPPPPHGQLRDRPVGSPEDREAGNSIDLITAEEIANAGVVSLDQILRGQVEGLVVGGSAEATGGSNLRIRGIRSIRAGESPLIYVDGVRVASDDVYGGSPGSGAASMLQSIRPQDIERIEVIKGSAASELYGEEARHGVIQIFTKRHGGGG